LGNKVRIIMKWFYGISRGEDGLVLPSVLAMLALGSLLIVPTLNYASTSLNAGKIIERKVEGLYAADAGIEDALWRIKNDRPSSFPYSYQLTNVNGMLVSVVIDEITTLSGEELGTPGDHSDWLEITKSVTYDGGQGTYFYTLSMCNNGEGNIQVETILIDFPPGLEYMVGSTSGDITIDNPAVIGDPATGITVIWDFSPPYHIIPEQATRNHAFQLSELQAVSDVTGHGFVKANREDIGTVWDSDSAYPYQIIAQAKDTTDTVVATIRAGVWAGTDFSISCWQVNPPLE